MKEKKERDESYIPSTSTLTTIPSVVSVSVALVALDVVHVGASVVASRT